MGRSFFTESAADGRSFFTEADGAFIMEERIVRGNIHGRVD
jgi:hypothetical protein